MRWENIIRDRLDSYESPLPRGGFEDLFIETPIHVNTLSKARQTSHYLLIPTALVACFTVLFYNGSTAYENCNVTPSILEPTRFADNTLDMENVAISESGILNQNVQLNSERKILPTLIVEDTIADPTKKKEDIRILSTPVIDSLSQFESNAEDPIESGVIKDVSQIAPKRNYADEKVLGIGASSLIAGCFLLQGMTDDRLSQGSSLPVDSTDPNPSPRHFLPLKVGLSVGIPLSQRWRITSGVSYSRYSSEVYSPSLRKQRVHYLGFPLRIDGGITVGERYEIYAGVGIEEELCISATKAGDAIPHDYSVVTFQSVIGTQWRLTEHMAVYAEPTLIWAPFGGVFSPENALTDDPFSFSISFGLRYCFSFFTK